MCFWLYFGLDFRKAIAAFVDLRRRKFENNDDKHVEHFYFSNCVLSFLYRRGGGGGGLGVSVQTLLVLKIRTQKIANLCSASPHLS